MLGKDVPNCNDYPLLGDMMRAARRTTMGVAKEGVL